MKAASGRARVSHQGPENKQRQWPESYLSARGHTVQTHSGCSASCKSTLAHARQRMLTVCSLTWRDGVKNQMVLQASSSTLLNRSVGVFIWRSKALLQSTGPFFFFLWSSGCGHNKHSHTAASTREICRTGGRVISTAAGKGSCRTGK